MRLKLRLYQVTHWEYWSMKAVYYPIFPIWLYLALKARSFFFFNAANPSIKNGGMAMESKKEIYDIIPKQYIPKTVLIKKDTKISELVKTIFNEGISLPMIAKPDIGMKALGVEKIETLDQLKLYLEKASDDFLIQELIDYPNEVGIFYVRHPDQQRGTITGIVSKEFLSVIGNGRDTILQLIMQNPRSYFQLSSLKRKYGNLLNQILPENERFVLVPYGSHTRGAKFIDYSNKRNQQLLETINSICYQIPGFYYGRLDVLYSSFEELSEGKNFRIIEINGAGSEPTHIYDPKHSLFFAWKEIIRHWSLLCEISLVNKKKGHSYLSFKDGRNMLRATSRLEAQLRLI